MRWMILICTLMVLSPVSKAQSGWDFLAVMGDAEGTTCNAGGPGLVHVYVLHGGTSGTKGSRFSMPIPECMNGTIYLGEYTSYDAVGNSQSGVTVDYGSCLTSDVLVLGVTLFLSDSTEDCCFYVPHPHPGSGSRKAEVFDCSMNPFDVRAFPVVVNATPECACGGCGMIRPIASNPFPPDNESDVPLNVLLTWDTYDPESVPTEHTMFFGTDPDPPEIQGLFTAYSFDPGPLEPSTTYNWRVGIWWHCGGALTKGPIWQFTTTSDVPAQRHTWGSIKALYRAN